MMRTDMTRAAAGCSAEAVSIAATTTATMLASVCAALAIARADIFLATGSPRPSQQRHLLTPKLPPAQESPTHSQSPQIN